MILEKVRIYKLESRVNEVTNVHLMGTIPKKEYQHMGAEDVALIPLRNIDLLQVPFRQNFEHLAFAKPLILGIKGKLMNFYKAS